MVNGTITAATVANVTNAMANVTTAMANVTTAMANITTTAMANITTTAMANITTAMADFTTTAMADFTTTVIADITNTVIEDITTTVIDDITTTAIIDTTAAASTIGITDIIATDATATPAAVDPLTVAKTVAMLVLGLGSFALGIAPLALIRRWCSGSFYPRAPDDPPHHQHQRHQHPGEAASGSRAVSLLLCFGAGVLLCTTLLHLQPEARAAVTKQQYQGRLTDMELLADMLFCVGFFMVLMANELAHTVLDSRCCGSSRRRPGASTLRAVSPCSAAEQPSASVSLASFRESAEQERQESLENKSTESQQQQQTRQRYNDDADNVEKQWTEKSDGQSLRGLFAILALSFHELFEGLAVGLESRVDHVWYLFVAVATHKFVIAFYVGLDLAWSNTRRAVLAAYVGTFAAVTPVGIACGMVITRFGETGTYGSPGPVAVVLQCLAAGTLLFVVFFEMLARHRQSGCAHLAAIVIGFGTLLLLQTITHHHHYHHHYPNGNEHGQVNNFEHDHEHFPYHDHHSIHEHDHSN